MVNLPEVGFGETVIPFSRLISSTEIVLIATHVDVSDFVNLMNRELEKTQYDDKGIDKIEDSLVMKCSLFLFFLNRVDLGITSMINAALQCTLQI